MTRSAKYDDDDEDNEDKGGRGGWTDVKNGGNMPEYASALPEPPPN